MWQRWSKRGWVRDEEAPRHVPQLAGSQPATLTFGYQRNATQRNATQRNATHLPLLLLLCLLELRYPPRVELGHGFLVRLHLRDALDLSVHEGRMVVDRVSSCSQHRQGWVVDVNGPEYMSGCPVLAPVNMLSGMGGHEHEREHD